MEKLLNFYIMSTSTKGEFMYRRSMQIEMRNEKIHNKPKKTQEAVNVKESLWSPENIAKNRERYLKEWYPWRYEGKTRQEWLSEGWKKTYKDGCGLKNPWEIEAA